MKKTASIFLSILALTLLTFSGYSQSSASNWKQLEIGTPFGIQPDPETVEQLQHLSVTINADTLTLNGEYQGKFTTTTKSAMSFFSLYEGVAEYIADYLSHKNSDISETFPVLDFSRYPNTIPADYLITGSMIYTGEYLFIVYKQTHIAVYQRIK